MGASFCLDVWNEPPSSRRPTDVHRTSVFKWVRVLLIGIEKRHPIGCLSGTVTGLECRFRHAESYRAAAVQPTAGRCPPDICI